MQAPSFKNKDVQALFEAVQSRDPDQPEFLQAVEEVLQTMEPVFEKHPECAALTSKPCHPAGFRPSQRRPAARYLTRLPLAFSCGLDASHGSAQALHRHAPWWQCGMSQHTVCTKAQLCTPSRRRTTCR